MKSLSEVLEGLFDIDMDSGEDIKFGPFYSIPNKIGKLVADWSDDNKSAPVYEFDDSFVDYLRNYLKTNPAKKLGFENMGPNPGSLKIGDWYIYTNNEIHFTLSLFKIIDKPNSQTYDSVAINIGNVIVFDKKQISTSSNRSKFFFDKNQISTSGNNSKTKFYKIPKIFYKDLEDLKNKYYI